MYLFIHCLFVFVIPCFCNYFTRQVYKLIFMLASRLDLITLKMSTKIFNNNIIIIIIIYF